MRTQLEPLDLDAKGGIQNENSNAPDSSRTRKEREYNESILKRIMMIESILRQMNQTESEKMSDVDRQLQKEREKSRALFGEVVRLGEVGEKTIAAVSSLEVSAEARLQAVEKKSLDVERGCMSVEAKIASINENVGKVFEAIKEKFSALETRAAEAQKNIRQIEERNTRVESQTKGSLDELRFSTDNTFESTNMKMNARLAETNRMIDIERGERKTTLENTQIEISNRLRMSESKIASELESINRKINILESGVKAEAQRNRENGERMIVAIEESERRQIKRSSEIVDEVRRLFDSYRAEMDNKLRVSDEQVESHKRLLVGIYNRVEEVVRKEIEARFSSDIQLKELASTVFDSVTSELGEFRKWAVDETSAIASEIVKMKRETNNNLSVIMRTAEEKIQRSEENLLERFELLDQKTYRVANESAALCGRLLAKTEDTDSRVTDTERRLEEIKLSLISEVSDFSAAFNSELDLMKKGLELKLQSFNSDFANKNQENEMELNNLGKSIEEAFLRQAKESAAMFKLFEQELNQRFSKVHENIQECKGQAELFEDKTTKDFIEVSNEITNTKKVITLILEYQTKTIARQREEDSNKEVSLKREASLADRVLKTERAQAQLASRLDSQGSEIIPQLQQDLELLKRQVFFGMVKLCDSIAKSSKAEQDVVQTISDLNTGTFDSLRSLMTLISRNIAKSRSEAEDNATSQSEAAQVTKTLQAKFDSVTEAMRTGNMQLRQELIEFFRQVLPGAKATVDEQLVQLKSAIDSESKDEL